MVAQFEADSAEAMAVLENAVARFAALLPRPVLKGPAGRQWWQYEQETREVVILLKAVRLVSGLNALTHLARAAFTQEMAVVLRTADDCVDEITFLLEGAVSDALTVDQQRFVEIFFSERLQADFAEHVRNPPREKRVERRKIQSAEGRFLSPSNPHDVRMISAGIDSVLAGYVHSGYVQIMELYSGRRFDLHGQPVRLPVYIRQVAHYIFRSLAVFATFAHWLGEDSLRDNLRTEAHRYGQQMGLLAHQAP